MHPDDQTSKRRKASPNGQDRDIDAEFAGSAPILHINSIAIVRTDDHLDSARPDGSSGNASDVQSRAASAEPATNGIEVANGDGLAAPAVIRSKKGKGPSSSDDDCA